MLSEEQPQVVSLHDSSESAGLRLKEPNPARYTGETLSGLFFFLFFSSINVTEECLQKTFFSPLFVRSVSGAEKKAVNLIFLTCFDKVFCPKSTSAVCDKLPRMCNIAKIFN